MDDETFRQWLYSDDGADALNTLLRVNRGFRSTVAGRSLEVDSMVPPQSFLHAELAERRAIESEFVDSLRSFRQLEPEYLRVEYDWAYGGTRLVVSRDPDMFKPSQRHLPPQLRRKEKDLCHNRLGSLTERRKQVRYDDICPPPILLRTQWSVDAALRDSAQRTAREYRDSKIEEDLLHLSADRVNRLWLAERATRQTLEGSEGHQFVVIMTRFQEGRFYIAEREAVERAEEERRQAARYARYRFEYVWEHDCVIARTVEDPAAEFLRANRHIPEQFRKPPRPNSARMRDGVAEIRPLPEQSIVPRKPIRPATGGPGVSRSTATSQFVTAAAAPAVRMADASTTTVVSIPSLPSHQQRLHSAPTRPPRATGAN